MWGSVRSSVPGMCVSHHLFNIVTYKYCSAKVISVWDIRITLAIISSRNIPWNQKCVTQTVIPLCFHLPCHCTYLGIQLYRLSSLQEMSDNAKLQSVPFLLCVFCKLQAYYWSRCFAYQKYSSHPPIIY